MRIALFATSLMLGGALTLAAQQPPARSYVREVPDSLAAQARISEDSARAIAQHRIPRGVVRKLEVERERGHLIYSWELKIPGHAGVEEVNVDALTGRIVGVEHENEPAPADTTRKHPNLTRHPPVPARP